MYSFCIQLPSKIDFVRVCLVVHVHVFVHDVFSGPMSHMATCTPRPPLGMHATSCYHYCHEPMLSCMKFCLVCCCIFTSILRWWVLALVHILSTSSSAPCTIFLLLACVYSNSNTVTHKHALHKHYKKFNITRQQSRGWHGRTYAQCPKTAFPRFLA